MTDAIGAASQKTKKRGDSNRRNETIETIEQPAVSRNDLTGVLHAETSLDRRFKQITQLRHGRQNGSKQQQWT